MKVKKPTILIVENDAIQRDLMTLSLNRISCQILTAANGIEAIHIMETVTPAIILLDLFLPQMSGLEVIAWLKDTGKLCRTTVIVISSLGFTEVVQQAKNYGAYDFLIKPIEGDLLIDRVKSGLNRRSK